MGIQHRCTVPTESTHPFNISPTVPHPLILFSVFLSTQFDFSWWQSENYHTVLWNHDVLGGFEYILGRSDPWYDWVWTAVPWKPFSVSFLSPSLSCLPINPSIHHMSLYLSLQFPPPLELFFLTCHEPGDGIMESCRVLIRVWVGIRLAEFTSWVSYLITLTRGKSLSFYQPLLPHL